MLILYGLISFLIGWIWIDYYRLIDIYDKERLKYIILTFGLGCLSILIVYGIGILTERWATELNGNFLNDLLYCTVQIGMVEEFAKFVPFLIVYFLFKSQINEPVDFLIFMCVSALGFATIENTLYFYRYGPDIINGRAILSTVGHMFDASLTAYGIILFKYNKNRRGIFVPILFFLLAAILHGFYDFLIMYIRTDGAKILLIYFYFLITISVFATILNNSLNNSSFFTYKRVVNSNKVAGRLLTYYIIIFGIQLLLLSFTTNLAYAVGNMIYGLYTSGFTIIISSVRLSRFKLIKDRWQPIRIELPFNYEYNGSLERGKGFSFPFTITVKGDGFNETYINAYYQEYFYLHPVSHNNTYINEPQLAFIEQKLFLKSDETFYLTRIFKNNDVKDYTYQLFQPKTNGITMISDKYPIVAVLIIPEGVTITPDLSGKDFDFQEWAYIKPVEPGSAKH